MLTTDGEHPDVYEWHPAFQRNNIDAPVSRLDRIVRAAGWVLLVFLALFVVASLVTGTGDHARFHGD